MKHIKTLLCRLFPRFKLRCILRALDLKTVKWQTDYALGRSNTLLGGRATGKTVAVMLRALMQSPSIDTLAHIIAADPDYIPGDRNREHWYRWEYDTFQRKCSEAWIPVPKRERKTSTRHSGWWTA